MQSEAHCFFWLIEPRCAINPDTTVERVVFDLICYLRRLGLSQRFGICRGLSQAGFTR